MVNMHIRIQAQDASFWPYYDQPVCHSQADFMIARGHLHSMYTSKQFI